MGLSGTDVKIKLDPIPIKYHNFKGTDYAKKYFEKLKEKQNRVLVYFDPDIDGLISGFLVCRYLNRLGIGFSWKLNSNREHGFKIPYEKLKDLDIIAVDFQISEAEVKNILQTGCNILNMDHHENGDKFIAIGYKGKIGVVINNQYPFEEEDSRYLSGAGVVFEVLRQIDPTFDTVENRALVGLTLLSDVRDIENENAKGYLIDLFTHKCKGYIGYLIDSTKPEIDYGMGVPRLDRNYVDYTLSPIINSCLRFNQEDMVMKYIMGSNYIDKTYKTKQQDLVNEMLSCAKMTDYEHLRIVVVSEADFLFNEYKDLLSNFIGLVANRFLDGVHSVIACLMTPEGQFKRASFRGRVNGGGYLDELLKTGLIRGAGHGSAFGVFWLDLSDESCKKLSSICGNVDGLDVSKPKVEYVKNMSVFSAVKGFNIGIGNMFCLAQNRTKVKYIGENIVKKRDTGRYVEWEVDGIQVKCFDNALHPSKNLILPMCERNYIYYYLEDEVDNFSFDD